MYDYACCYTDENKIYCSNEATKQECENESGKANATWCRDDPRNKCPLDDFPRRFYIPGQGDSYGVANENYWEQCTANGVLNSEECYKNTDDMCAVARPGILCCTQRTDSNAKDCVACYDSSEEICNENGHTWCGLNLNLPKDMNTDIFTTTRFLSKSLIRDVSYGGYNTQTNDFDAQTAYLTHEFRFVNYMHDGAGFFYEKYVDSGNDAITGNIGPLQLETPTTLTRNVQSTDEILQSLCCGQSCTISGPAGDNSGTKPCSPMCLTNFKQTYQPDISVFGVDADIIGSLSAADNPEFFFTPGQDFRQCGKNIITTSPNSQSDPNSLMNLNNGLNRWAQKTMCYATTNNDGYGNILISGDYGKSSGPTDALMTDFIIMPRRINSTTNTFGTLSYYDSHDVGRYFHNFDGSDCRPCTTGLTQK